MKSRKTILAAILAVLMMLMLAACGGKGAAAEAGSPFTGSWKIASIKAMGIDMTVEQLGNFGLDEEQKKMISDFSIELRDGGDCTFTAGGEKADGKWETKDETSLTMTVGDQSVNCTLEDGDLIMDMEELTGMEMTAKFVKQ